jgi:methionyl-tRNA formyltransferase
VRVVILTGMRNGLASRCLPALAAAPGVEIAGIVFCEAHYRSRREKLRRDLKKMWRIGPFGVLAGLWLRRCYAGEPEPDLFAVAAAHRIPVETTPRTNAPRTAELLAASRAELGLSLGNSYLAKRVYSVPPGGMLNVHGEILPRFQGAASVIWAIHEGVRETGFTIHQIDAGIDTGKIVYQERFPIEFSSSFSSTVSRNVAEIARRIPPALARVVSRYPEYAAAAQAQTGGRSYTTPTLRQFLRMLEQHRRLKLQANDEAAR